MRAGAEPSSLWIRVLRPRPASLLAVLALLGAACGAEPERPEAELRRTVERIVRGIVAKDPHAVLEYIAPEYRGEDGLRYIDVQSILLSFLLRDGSVRAKLESLEVDPAGADGSHRVRATLRFGQGPTGDPGPTVC